MYFWPRKLILPLLAIITAAISITGANAHLIDAQNGTLNFAEDGAYLVLSLPLSAFSGIDEDQNGKVSMIEFNNHRTSVIAAIERQVVLSSDSGALILDGIMLSPQSSHDMSNESISQVVVLGRFTYAEFPRSPNLHVSLFGDRPAEQFFKITANHSRDNVQRIYSLTPAHTSAQLFKQEG